MVEKMKKQNVFFIAFIFSLIAFFPTFLGGMSLGAGQKILYVLYPFLLGFFILGYRKIEFPYFCAFLFSLFFIFYLTVVSKLGFINVQIAASHFRYMAYFMVFLFTFNIAKRYALRLAELRKALLYVLLLVFVFIVAQFVVPDLILSIGITNRTTQGNVGLTIGGPFIWSYSLGFCILPIFFIILASIFNGVGGFKAYLLLCLTSLVVLAGQSKASYLAYAINFLVAVPFAYKYGIRNKVNGVVFFLTILFAVLVTYVIYNLEEFGNIYRFINGITGQGSDASTQARLNQLAFISHTLEQNLLLGYPIQPIVIENGYGYYLYNYGVVGLLLYLTLLTSLVFCAVRFVVRAHQHLSQFSSSDRTVLFGYLAMAIGGSIYSLASSPLDGHKDAYFFWTLTGLVFGCFQNHIKSTGRTQKQNLPYQKVEI
ncbi:hypothetical protein CWC05_13715 [Pseudoalteromonas ruthenica]|uniref:O-antigen polymerase n=1 Tax=Pseudoalteromonas ruthenica TaxID=151081 RepID=A0A5S3Z2G0_9GAMM|nr:MULTISPECIES: hypothetical protein [Pseudoalteromonas]MCF2862052.1 hypothetical protein [Pseudoalteromonas sp. CNAT2-18]MCG7543688.1 hypothetical protein [Pseudoalteromonas sp. MM17-2]MCG7558179.1 hypothetical protein [Pseudoalteromonas sp. CNAT2-18.1]MCG7569880.1 hypothetical protein [Pseudoalteromonas sp. CNC9-20]TMP86459.1 hypothetical protein CWC05_13715 [Pseudoalteromonas ruthenica]